MIRYNKKLIKICTDNNLTISLAESCTGGLITSSLISVSGASKVIDIGLIKRPTRQHERFNIEYRMLHRRLDDFPIILSTD